MSRTTKFAATTALTAAFVTTSALNVHAATLAEAINMAIANHPDVAIAAKDRDAIEHLVDVAKAGYKPTVDFVAGSGYEHSNNTSTRTREARTGDDDGDRDMWRSESRLSVVQNLFNGFQTKAQVKQQENRFQSAQYNVLETREIIALRAVEAYLGVMRQRELVALGEENLSNHVAYYNKISERVNSGRGSQADARQAEGRVALAKANLIQAQAELRNAEGDYIEVIGEAPNFPTKTATPFERLPENLESAIAYAFGNHPAIHSAAADIAAAKSSKKEAKCLFCPDINFEGGVSRNRNLDGIHGVNNDATAMIFYRQNLYNGGADKATIEEREERIYQAEAGLEQTRRLVQENVHQAWAALEGAHLRLAPLGEHVAASEASRGAYLDQFDLGQRSLLDLLDSEIEVFNSRTSLINGKYDVDLAAYQLLAHTGDLVGVAGTQVASAQ